jgi:hypothetical protein
MRTCEVSAAIQGQPHDGLQEAVKTFTANGFEITHWNSESVSLTGPGMYSNKQNPLLGASQVELAIQRGALHLNAELGGVETMRRFLYRFPFLLGLSLGLVFAVLGGFLLGRRFGVGFGVPWAPGWRWLAVAMASAMLPVAPWVVISPLIAASIGRRTERALQVLVNNATKGPNRS